MDAARTTPDISLLRLSVFVVCQDAAPTIRACLQSVASAAEIVVVDSGSTDDTLAIIEGLRGEGLPIRLIKEAWRGFAAQKQFALEQCQQPWCLNLDADEVVSSALLAELPDLMADTGVNGWVLPRRDHLQGYGLAHPLAARDDVLRLIRRDKAHYDLERIIHESPAVTGRVARHRGGDILHYADTRFLPHLERGLRNARLKAEMRRAVGKGPSMLRLLFSPIGRFMKIFILRRFFLNGVAGLRYAAVGAIYAFASEMILFEQARGESSKS